MSPASILLSVRDGTGEGCYRFLCPTCLNPVEKPADRKIVALLISAGVDLADPDEDLFDQDQVLPQLPAEDAPRSDAPPFTRDDLLEFHFLLQDDEILARELLGAV